MNELNKNILRKKEELPETEQNKEARLHIYNESGYMKTYLLKERMTIGRGSSQNICDIILPSPIVSRQHGEIFIVGNAYHYRDIGSTNGTYINGILYKKGGKQEAQLKDGDTISFEIFGANARAEDRIVCVFEQKNTKGFSGEAPISRVDWNKSELNIAITERSVVQHFKKRKLLADINLSIHSGEMVLILGGSGAGKTTFMNAVMGYEKAEGRITYNNIDIYEEYERMKYEIGYVPQMDLLRNSDSVYDTLANAAEMKLPKKLNDDWRENRIEETLKEFGMIKERHTLVSKLSGGQRKRLSIAVEYISDPSLFFLDEPDSGLDDVIGRGLMENLRTIANKGKIVMVITHSPERASNLFDKIIVLAKSEKDNCGRLAFYGTKEEAFEFFGISSFAEIVKKINPKDENGEGLADQYIDKFKIWMQSEGRM